MGFMKVMNVITGGFPTTPNHDSTEMPNSLTLFVFQGSEEDSPPAAAETKAEEEEIDIDLEDPQTEKAAIMIQAQFRGFKTRKDIDTTKSGMSPGKSSPPNVMCCSDDPILELATTLS